MNTATLTPVISLKPFVSNPTLVYLMYSWTKVLPLNRELKVCQFDYLHPRMIVLP